MARREDDSYTNGSVYEASVEEGMKDKSEAYAEADDVGGQPEEASDGDALCGVQASVAFIQQLIAEFLATFFLIFAGCGVSTVNEKNGMATFPGVAVVWGMTVMAMIYAVGHVSGAHINPAVTVGFAISGRFPWKKVPAYMVVQTVAATAASLMLRLMFGGRHEPAPVTAPTGSNMQSLVLEFIITFYLMFVIMAVATDDRAVGQMAGLAVGGTIMLNALFAGPVSGASMNPARSIGPALVGSKYRALWVYIFGPVAGAAAGAWAYNLVRRTDRTLGEIKSAIIRPAN
ncbi:aquaporin NIP1-4-like [Panicum virgatum]|uniref:aquaporin NIP1-4-like n=1 Tax=Panicum virgatum TaxID=38727 RepID=UPI0019D56A9A|nr:aquaporin NIP1-4-like [Panicum virgatum]